MIMKNYVIYDDATGNILETGATDEAAYDLRVADVSHRDGQSIIEVDGLLVGCEKTFKVDPDQKLITEKLPEELSLQEYDRRKNEYPPIHRGMNDTEINLTIEEFFLGYVDPTSWRDENYWLLRRRNYPPIEEFIDAQVKMASKEKTVVEEGTAQFDAYVQKCLGVKQKYPKPTTVAK
jgi:hypothetical protein